jgi:hypothetical protein
MERKWAGRGWIWMACAGGRMSGVRPILMEVWNLTKKGKFDSIQKLRACRWRNFSNPLKAKMSGPTGGIQGMKGTLFGRPYKAGSWQDKLIEAFSGTHDMVGGKLSGLYDEQGNAARGRSDATIKFHDTWSATGAIVLSTPFAAAELLPPEVWQAISILLKAAK